VSAVWITCFFLFLDRVNISLAAPHIIEDLGLNATQMGLILSVYYWGYLFGQLTGGFASDRFRIRPWALVFYVVWCIATILTGFCRTIGQFVVARLVFGVAEGAVANPCNKIINNWVLPNERGLVYGAQSASCYIGLVAGMPIVGLLIEALGWRQMFIWTGVATVLGVLAFWYLIYDHPADHPRISAKERDFIQQTLARDRVTFDDVTGTAKTLPFKDAIRMTARDGAFWGICFAFLFVAGMYFTNLSWLPGYLVMERGFTGLNSGYALMPVYAAAAAGALLIGHVADRIGKRCVVAIVCCLLTIPSIAGVLWFENRAAVVAMLSVMVLFNSAGVVTIGTLLFDLLPAETVGMGNGLMFGIFGGLGGILGPLILGRSFDLTGSFMTGFVIMGLGLGVAIALLSWVHRHEMHLRRQRARRRIRPVHV